MTKTKYILLILKSITICLLITGYFIFFIILEAIILGPSWWNGMTWGEVTGNIVMIIVAEIAVPLFFSIWGGMIVHEDIEKIKKFKNKNKTK